jgi:heparan-alpha-glucosaminide N-acetyltransferase
MAVTSTETPALESTATGTLAAGRPNAPQARPESRRYVSLDAFRGFIMVILASEGFGFSTLQNDPAWGSVARWFDHVPWQGGVFWDMIQPAFMFMVGVAMPFALARRRELGATESDNLRHVLVRAVRLIILSQIIIWVGAGRIKPQLINVLSQIAFTYVLSYFIMKLRWPYQVGVAIALLAGWTALFFAFPGPDGPFSPRNHIGLRVDRAIFHYDYDPAYSTLNFIPSTVWTLAGVWVGKLLMKSKAHSRNLVQLAGAMVACFTLAFALRPWIPFIKQLCTASFMLYSLGWVLFMLIGFYGIVEVLGYRKWAFPLIVVGMNSIFIYFVSEVLFRWLDRAVGVFTFHYNFVGKLAPVAQASTVLLVMWGMCYWLYKRKIFFKL